MKKDKNEDTLKPNELALIRGMLNYKLNDITKRKDGLFSPSELRKAVPLIDAANFPKYLKGNKNEKIRGLMKRDLSYMRTFLHIDKNRITRRISHHGLRKDKEAFRCSLKNWRAALQRRRRFGFGSNSRTNIGK